MVIWMLSALIIAFHSFFGELCFRKAVYSVAEEARLRTAAQG